MYVLLYKILDKNANHTPNILFPIFDYTSSFLHAGVESRDH